MSMLGAGGTDRELLDHYVDGGDPRAFEDLVERHGSAVHRVCRGVLNDAHEAEDAAQATFLLLARKAPEIRDADALGGWLRGVAYRIAIRARRRAARRREIEKARSEMSRDESSPAPEGPDGELKQLVGDELKKLPDDYRRPIVLCYLDGLTHQEAARRLEWPVGTVKVRLVRGRRLLRERLNRRGVALGAGLLVMLPPGRRARAVTGPFAEATTRGKSPCAGRGAGSKPEHSLVRELSQGAGRIGLTFGAGWLWAALVVAAVSLALAAPIAGALGGPPVSEVDPSTLPTNLTDVLNVECR